MIRKKYLFLPVLFSIFFIFSFILVWFFGEKNSVKKQNVQTVCLDQIASMRKQAKEDGYGYPPTSGSRFGVTFIINPSADRQEVNAFLVQKGFRAQYSFQNSEKPFPEEFYYDRVYVVPQNGRLLSYGEYTDIRLRIQNDVQPKNIISLDVLDHTDYFKNKHNTSSSLVLFSPIGAPKSLYEMIIAQEKLKATSFDIKPSLQNEYYTLIPPERHDDDAWLCSLAVGYPQYFSRVMYEKIGGPLVPESW